MGIFKRQEAQMALRYLKWHYSKSGQSMPSPEFLNRRADEIVNEAHRIAGQRGRNVLFILKDMLEQLKK